MGYAKGQAEDRQNKAKAKRIFKGSVKSGDLTVKDFPMGWQLTNMVALAGDRLSWGMTSDGGAVCVTLINGPAPYSNFYASNVEEASQVLETILEGYSEREKQMGGF